MSYKDIDDLIEDLQSREDDRDAKDAAFEIRRLKAEVERLKEEKQRRVHWQDLCYHAMNAVDRILGKDVSKGTGTTEDTFKEDVLGVEYVVASLEQKLAAVEELEDKVTR